MENIFGMIKISMRKYLAEMDYDDFFSRFDFVNYPDRMGDFDDK
jgi:hypothetical protein|tara:strand:+ start:494 stop:625 length:132 start_codon:yes stop_codon:yes gene_type:complete